MKLNRYSFVCFILIFLLSNSGFPQAGAGGLQLPYVFTDQMVFQRDKPIRIWGQNSPGEKVKVEFFDQKNTTKSDTDGNWMIEFPPMKSGGPGSLTIQSGKEKIRIKDILIGEVWICEGQSNMYWPLENSDNGELEILKSDYPNIRLLDMQAPAWPWGGNFSLEQLENHFPEYYYTGSWELCSPESSPKFSAVAYHFGKELHDSLGVPVGLIDLAVGGVPTESFISVTELRDHPELKNILDNWFENELVHPWVRSRTRENLKLWFDKPAGPRPRPPFEPGMLSESGIEPILPLQIRGAIWYQGESNLPTEGDYYPGTKAQNRELFHLLINSWRRAFDQGEFPFYYVQLPNINRDWAEYRDMQRKTLDEIPNTGMAVTIDIGNPGDVHPTNKKDVGHRLALWALAETYDNDLKPYSGPLPANTEISGNNIIIEFSHAGDGLKANKNSLSGFEIAGPNGRFLKANAEINQDKTILNNPDIELTVSARYAWALNPTLTLLHKTKKNPILYGF